MSCNCRGSGGGSGAPIYTGIKKKVVERPKVKVIKKKKTEEDERDSEQGIEA